MRASGSGISPLLDRIDLVIFDKDGTLIAIDAMWGGWANGVGAALDAATNRAISGRLFAMLGYDPATGRVSPHGGLAATPMARLRERTRALLMDVGLDERGADRALQEAWHAPDPVALALPLVDLHVLLGRLRASGRRVAVATTDDRAPTERTLAALELTDLIDAIACADDGLPEKPAPDMVVDLCARLGVAPGRTAVIGDSPADLEMGRAAGAGIVIGVLSGVGDATHLAARADLILDSVADLTTD